MSEENYGLSSNPMFGALIGQQVAINQTSDLNAKHARELAAALQDANSASSKNSEASLNLVTSYVAMRNELASLKDEVLELEGFDMGITSALAGVRGVTRELLSELRKADPTNPLLDKKNRDKVFDIVYNNQSERHKNKLWKEREDEATSYRDIAYGAPNSNDGGPEKSQISSNASVRAEAGVPEHVTDRERFMSLIKELHNTLAAKDPNAPILKSQTMIDVFTEYALNEMDRQPAAGSKNGV